MECDDERKRSARLKRVGRKVLPKWSEVVAKHWPVRAQPQCDHDQEQEPRREQKHEVEEEEEAEEEEQEEEEEKEEKDETEENEEKEEKEGEENGQDGDDDTGENAPGPRRHLKRKARDHCDVPLQLFRQLPEVYALRERIDNSDGNHEQELADLANLIGEILELPVCISCFVEVPSSRVRRAEFCLEAWKYRNHNMVCAYCGDNPGAHDGSQTRIHHAYQSLRRRVRTECELAFASVPNSCPPALKQALPKCINELGIKHGQGRGGRRKKDKIASHQWIVPQIYRTLDRLLVEPNMEKERAALLLVMKALSAR